MISAKEALERSDYVNRSRPDITEEGYKILNDIESLIDKACKDGLYGISYKYYTTEERWYYDPREFQEMIRKIIKYLSDDLGYTVSESTSINNGSVIFKIEW